MLRSVTTLGNVGWKLIISPCFSHSPPFNCVRSQGTFHSSTHWQLYSRPPKRHSIISFCLQETLREVMGDKQVSRAKVEKRAASKSRFCEGRDQPNICKLTFRVRSNLVWNCCPYQFPGLVLRIIARMLADVSGGAKSDAAYIGKKLSHFHPAPDRCSTFFLIAKVPTETERLTYLHFLPWFMGLLAHDHFIPVRKG